MLFTPLALPNGALLPNRLGKAAMEENLADDDHAPSDKLIRLYRAWADGGVGLIVTGNAMIDRRALTGPGAVVLEDRTHIERFRRWTQAMRSGGAHAWLQISHPGRQTPAALGQPALAPSAVPLDMGSFSRHFAAPRAMTQEEIDQVIERFAHSASLAEEAGFTGVEIHAAHGYLLSQFLSPLANRRDDRWGGDAERRSQLLVEVIRRVRQAVTPGFVVAVKLNSADFQRGGFGPEDAKAVVQRLNPLGVDLVELSGGSYEAPAMRGVVRDGRTLAREAFFLEFAHEIAAVARMPLMVTGGIRRKAVAEQVLASGVSVVGLATALALNPRLPLEWRAGVEGTAALRPVTWANKMAGAMAAIAMVRHQMNRLSRGRVPYLGVSPLRALVEDQLSVAWQARRYRRWMAARSAA